MAGDRVPAPPPGYRGLAPLDRAHHSGRGLSALRRREFEASLDAVYLTLPEFFLAARHYVIAFANVDGVERPVPVVITGRIPGENLYATAAEGWSRDVYVPAYVRRFPFFTLPVRRGTDADEQMASVAARSEPDFLIAVDESGLVPDGPALFESGEPTAAWEPVERLVKDMEVAHRQTRRFSEALGDLDVLEPFEAHAVSPGGVEFRRASLLRVNEKRLNALAGRTVKTLMELGALSRIYAHLMSLDHFASLLDRGIARDRQAADVVTGTP